MQLEERNRRNIQIEQDIKSATSYIQELQAKLKVLSKRHVFFANLLEYVDEMAEAIDEKIKELDEIMNQWTEITSRRYQSAKKKRIRELEGLLSGICEYEVSNLHMQVDEPPEDIDESALDERKPISPVAPDLFL